MLDKLAAKKMIEKNYGYEVRVTSVYPGNEVQVQTLADGRYWLVKINADGTMVVVD
jgi:hypothetical protein